MDSDPDSLDYNDLNDEDVEAYLEYFWSDDEIEEE